MKVSLPYKQECCNKSWPTTSRFSFGNGSKKKCSRIDHSLRRIITVRYKLEIVVTSQPWFHTFPLLYLDYCSNKFQFASISLDYSIHTRQIVQSKCSPVIFLINKFHASTISQTMALTNCIT